MKYFIWIQISDFSLKWYAMWQCCNTFPWGPWISYNKFYHSQHMFCFWNLQYFSSPHFILLFFSFIFISWRLITLQYWSCFCHTLTGISHGFTCIPHPDHPPPPPSLPNPPGSSQCTRTITHQSGWLLSKSLQAINAGEGVEKREPSYTVGGNAN